MPKGYNIFPSPDNPEGGWHYKPKASICKYCGEHMKDGTERMHHMYSHKEFKEHMRQCRWVKSLEMNQKRIAWLKLFKHQAEQFHYNQTAIDTIQELIDRQEKLGNKTRIYESMAKVGTYLVQKLAPGECGRCPLPITYPWQDSVNLPMSIRELHERAELAWLRLLPKDQEDIQP